MVLSSFGQFKQFGQTLQAGLSKLGYPSPFSYMQESSVSGVSFSTGQPFVLALLVILM
ncbi:hypothetical protein [Gilliamella sp. App6-5]|jgi:hypothetical protein|uniref:hypothetical protein n=1 Tax=Gilliamella sp. App6-5 TaxID=3120232 RepID=UPI00159EC591|nr:hypothetical protein [Gilliamella apicola]